MAETHETITDIIAEMLGARTEFPFVYLIGEPDTPEVIDFTTKEIIEPRKINIRRVTVEELAERLKAALKRERGDCAKLREALEKISQRFFENGYGQHRAELNDEDRRMIESALAEPPRQCDVGTADEQAERFENFCLQHIGCAEETGGRHCVGCPLEKASRNTTQKCELYWAQMPHEEGGEK